MSKLRAKLAYMTAKKGWVQNNLAIGLGLEPSSAMLEMWPMVTWWSHDGHPILTGKLVLTQVHSSRPSITSDSQHPTPKFRMQKPKTYKIYTCHRKNEGGMNTKYSTTLNKYSQDQRITAPLRLERTSKTIGSKHQLSIVKFTSKKCPKVLQVHSIPYKDLMPGLCCYCTTTVFFPYSLCLEHYQF